MKELPRDDNGKGGRGIDYSTDNKQQDKSTTALRRVKYRGQEETSAIYTRTVSKLQ